MSHSRDYTQLELELERHERSPEDGDDAPDSAEVTEDETPPSSEEAFEHEDIWSDPDV